MSLFSRLLDPFGTKATVKAYQDIINQQDDFIESLRADNQRLAATHEKDGQELARLANLVNSHWDDFQSVEADRQRIAQELEDIKKRSAHYESAKVSELKGTISNLKSTANLADTIIKQRDDQIANLKIDLYAAMQSKNSIQQVNKTNTDIMLARGEQISQLEEKIKAKDAEIWKSLQAKEAAIQYAQGQANIVKAKEERIEQLEETIGNMANEARITDEMAERKLTHQSEELRKQDGALREIVAFVKHWANHYQVRENHESALYQIFERLEAAGKVEAVDGE